MVALRAHEIERFWALWTFGLVAVLFNPLLPIYLTREVWIPIDLLTAVLFSIVIADLREQAGGGASRQKYETRNRAYDSEVRSTSVGSANYVRRGLDLAAKLQANSKGSRKRKRG